MKLKCPWCGGALPLGPLGISMRLCAVCFNEWLRRQKWSKQKKRKNSLTARSGANR